MRIAVCQLQPNSQAFSRIMCIAPGGVRTAFSRTAVKCGSTSTSAFYHFENLHIRGMTNYHIEPHRTTLDHFWLNWRCLHRRRTACIPVVNHTLAPNSWKCLTYYRFGAHRILLLLLLSLLEETPLFHAAALREYYKAPLTGRYTVILSVGDMYDNIGQILLLWRPNLCRNRNVGPWRLNIQKFSKSSSN